MTDGFRPLCLEAPQTPLVPGERQVVGAPQNEVVQTWVRLVSASLRLSPLRLEGSRIRAEVPVLCPHT